ncbi:putative holin [Cellulophaga phage phi12:1]|nr:holin [Cellulophaga phage phi12:1]AGO48028.1 putative holin [Cellulophaga phage phi12:1]AGO48193.1 putative holin [Cellulophaga phage phi12:3]
MIYQLLSKHIYLIHSGSVWVKAESTAKIAVFVSPWYYLVKSINDWYFLNYGYVAFVFIAIAFDHFLGTWVHAWIKRDFSMKKNIYGFFTKITLVIMVGILTEGMQHILNSDSFISTYFSIVGKLMVFIYPAGSALMNCSIITHGKFPPIGLMNKIKNFNKNLDIKQFKPKEDENSDINRPYEE